MNISKKYNVYTVGHSIHTIDYFIELLKTFNINCIVDVRSIPASSYNPQYNQKALQNALKRVNILYLHFGEEFGAQHTEKNLLDIYGKVDFEKVRRTPKFLKGVERLKKGLNKKYNISLMCSEAEPFDCHRFSLISYHLARNNFDVKHILKDKTYITNEKLEQRLFNKYSKQIPQNNLFARVTNLDQLNIAYRLRNMDVAYNALNI